MPEDEDYQDMEDMEVDQKDDREDEEDKFGKEDDKEDDKEGDKEGDKEDGQDDIKKEEESAGSQESLKRGRGDPTAFDTKRMRPNAANLFKQDTKVNENS